MTAGDDLNPYAGVSAALAMAAWALSIAVTVGCNFVHRKVTITITGDVPPIENEELSDFLLQGHGIGFWSWEYQDGCYSYKFEGNTADFDAKFKAAKGFSVIPVFIGLFLFLALILSIRKEISPNAFWLCTLGLAFNCLFQGLTLLIFRSSVCEAGFFGFDVPDTVQVDASCSLASGSNMSIAATVLYFVAAVGSAMAAKKSRAMIKAESEEKELERAAEAAAREEKIAAKKEASAPEGPAAMEEEEEVFVDAEEGH